MAKIILTSKTSAMKSYLPILSLVLIFASCTSAYKSGQTPDDVYFSPARPQDEYVRVEKNDDRQYYSDEEYRDDRYLRMKIRNRRWSTLDDSYAYNYGYGYNYYPSSSYVYYNSWNAASLWNYYYNPYCSYNNIIISNPKSTVYNKPRSFNLHVFDNTVNPTNPKAYKNSGSRTSSGSSNTDSYRNSGTNAGGFLRNVFGGSDNSSNSSNSKVNTSSSSSNSSSSGSSSSGSSSNSGGRGNASRGRN
jgi:hypothetical protein